jgi:hypothetical protein
MTDENQNQGGLERELNNPFQKLKEAVGQKVKVDYVWYSSPHSDKRTLKNVEDYANIEIEGSGIPFVGYGSAIQRVTDEKGNVIYENPNISDSYDVRNPTEREDLVALTFGQNIADKMKDDRIRSDEDFKERKRKSDEHARTKTQDYLEQGKSLIREDVLNDWETYVTNNTQDGYSAGVVDASLRVMQALSEGKTPEEAEKVTYEMGITGFMAGGMAQAVSHFHPRGDEFKQYWNRQFMDEKNAETAKGVVNPAILTIGQKE